MIKAECIGVELFFLPIVTRVPLKFGPETVTSVTCARVRMTIRAESGATAVGWGETPLSVQWVWPSALAYDVRHEAMKRFCVKLAAEWVKDSARGHALEVGLGFVEHRLRGLLDAANALRKEAEPMPWLAALVACSPFDLALHDAYGNMLGRSSFDTLGPGDIGSDLSRWLEPANRSGVSFKGRYPSEYIASPAPRSLPAWHLVGGKDPIDESELTGAEPRDGYPVLLRDWIERDGLKCLKVKLKGDDRDWDLRRLVKVGRTAIDGNADWLSADFNCTVSDPRYVNETLDRLMYDHPRIFGMLLYVEQPFPYDLETHAIDVRSVAARKPLFLDESAHDWRLIRLGRELGWTGVALKTCKTLSGALLSLAWAREHGMTIMVQDLSNPMLAQIPHIQLAARARTIMGVETNGMQFYPEASLPEAQVHPGLFKRSHGCVDLSSIGPAGLGLRVDEIERALPQPAATCGDPKPAQFRRV